MIDADAVVALEGAGLIVPEGVGAGPVVAGADRVGEAEIEELAELRPALGLEQRVAASSGPGASRPAAPG